MQVQQNHAGAHAMKEHLTEPAILAWTGFIRTAQHVLEKVELDLKSAGLPPLVWYDVLLELARERDGRLRHRELHQRMLLAKYNLSRLIDRMEAEGLIVREPVADDARGAYIRITAAGRGLRKKMWPVYERAISAHFSGRLDESEMRELSRITAKLRARGDESPPQ